MLSSLQGRLDPVTIVGAALVVAAASGLPGLFIGRKDWGQKIAACSMIAASLAALPAAVSVIFASPPPVYVIDWTLPFGPCEFGIDGLSALFLIPIFLIAACGSCYSLAYLPAAGNRKTVPDSPSSGGCSRPRWHSW